MHFQLHEKEPGLCSVEVYFYGTGLAVDVCGVNAVLGVVVDGWRDGAIVLLPVVFAIGVGRRHDVPLVARVVLVVVCLGARLLLVGRPAAVVQALARGALELLAVGEVPARLLLGLGLLGLPGKPGLLVLGLLLPPVLGKSPCPILLSIPA